jgi:AraC-like DNA-binding protein
MPAKPSRSVKLDNVDRAITIRAAAYREQGLGYETKPHTQAIWQWYGVIHGNVNQTVDGRVNELGPWDSILIPPGAVRSPRCRDEAPGYFWVGFENHTLPLDAVQGRVLTTPPELRNEMRELARELATPGGANTEEMVQALAVRILVGLCRALGTDRPAAGTEHAPGAGAHAQERVARVEAFMRRNLNRPLAREDFASLVHLSPAQLARLFHAVVGKPVMDRFTELRMAAAREYLAESTMSVSEVALEVGYNSFSHFAASFRKRVGMSPSAYRASCNPPAG